MENMYDNISVYTNYGSLLSNKLRSKSELLNVLTTFHKIADSLSHTLLYTIIVFVFHSHVSLAKLPTALREYGEINETPGIKKEFMDECF